MKYILMLAVVLGLSACGDDEKVTKAESTAEQRADNPLLKMQDETTKKAEDAVNAALAKQKEALDSIDK
ncbi:hypothetical protein KRX19_07060 [Cardiobacteriaceae bacterium TAE3-ERU3]|nr:hypothetical protein [Cardiobacteriaceae bacterium TAE3-ERU3]